MSQPMSQVQQTQNGAETQTQPIRNAVLRPATSGLPSGLTAQNAMRAQTRGYAPSLTRNGPFQTIPVRRSGGLGYLGDDSSSSDWAYFDGPISADQSAALAASTPASGMSGSTIALILIGLFALSEMR